ncbi:glycosyltransferase [Oceaniglobus trochenteri]|uniref:glycosyltransferase n=1 Tax=Oceaniglobus trochenteri TaxID=2763260 RepID=UPI001D00183E|nr:glycosyltransferase [Oceaniglobus trochenteri]
MKTDELPDSEIAYFDAEWYRETYPDVAHLGMPPLEHFLKYGAGLGRSPGPEFNAALYRWRNDLPATENPIAHFARNYTFSAPRTQEFPMGDLKRKLWGGFSRSTLELLHALTADKSAKASVRADAALLLARWYALQEMWDEALAHINIIKAVDKARFRNRKTKILLIDCSIRAGLFEQARNYIDFELGKGQQGDFVCALMNMVGQGGEDGQKRSQLDILNALYEAHGFVGVRLKEPEKGFVFGNILEERPERTVDDGPLVSILVPVYNAGEFLGVAMRSLLCQSWTNIEIIAVEDRSPDDSWEQLEEMARQDPRLKIYRNDVNMGAYPTRNRAMSLASGDYITVHDSDDWSHPQMIEAQMRALLDNPEVRGTCSMMTRVYPDLSFILRPQRENLEYVHRSYPSLLLRRSDLQELGEWDSVSANADDELMQRARVKWGADSILDIHKEVPFSFFLVHENSLTQQAGTNLSSLTFGIRREYSRQATYWRTHKKDAEKDGMQLKRTSLKSPFPIPAGLAPKNWPRDTYYDLIIVSDLSLLGGTRRCNEGYIRAARASGLRVGLFHWPRFDLKLAEVADEYVEASYDEGIDILVPEDKVQAGLVLIHHPPILGTRIDAVPQIDAGKVGILVNQSPMQRWSQNPTYYTGPEASQMCLSLFDKVPEWIAISPRTRHILEKTGGFTQLSNDIWYPPLGRDLPEKMPALPKGLGKGGVPVLGRHARSHWTKWPHTADGLRDAYCADAHDIRVRLLGGAKDPQKMLGTLPANWEVLEFDSVEVASFIQDLDFFLHYVHEDYIEEFGRNVMEAMALGRVVILPPGLADIFGDAAVYAEPRNVADTLRKLWADPKAYRAQAEKGFAFVRKNCAPDVIARRLVGAIPARAQAQAAQ